LLEDAGNRGLTGRVKVASHDSHSYMPKQQQTNLTARKDLEKSAIVGMLQPILRSVKRLKSSSSDDFISALIKDQGVARVPEPRS
jgi:hypothetical protein